MRKIVLLSTLMFFVLFGYSQKIVSVSNPLEKILQNDFDSTIIYSIHSNWDNSPNYFIVSKKSNVIYFYRYSINRKTYLGRDFSPMKSELSKKLIHLVTDFDLTKPDINPFFIRLRRKLVKLNLQFSLGRNVLIDGISISINSAGCT